MNNLLNIRNTVRYILPIQLATTYLCLLLFIIILMIYLTIMVHIWALISTNTTFIIHLMLSCGSTYFLSFLQTLLSLSILCYHVAPHISSHFYKHYFHYLSYTILWLHIFPVIYTNTTFIIYLILSCGSTYFLSFLQTLLSLSILHYLVAPHITCHFYKHYFHYLSHAIMWLHILPVISTNTTFIIYLTLSCGSTYFLSFLQTLLSLSILCYHVAPHITCHFYKHYFHYLSYTILWLHIFPLISTNITFIIYLMLSCGSTYYPSFLQTLFSLSILHYLVTPHISSHFYKHYFHYLSYAIMWLHILPVISTNTTFIIYLTLSCGSTYFLSFLQTLLSLSILYYHVAPHISSHFYKHYFHYLSYTILWLHILPVISTNTTFIIYLMLSCGSTYYLSFLQTLLSLSILCYHVAPHISCHFYKHYFHYLSYAIMWLHIFPLIYTNTTFIIYLILSCGSTYFLSFLQTLLSLSILYYHVAPHISSHFYKHYFHYLSYTILWLHILPVISTNTTFIIYLMLSCGSTYYLSFLQTLLSLSILCYHVAPHISCHFYKHYFHYLSYAIMWLHIFPLIYTNTTFIIYLILSCGSTYFLSFLQTLLSLSILYYHVAPHISSHFYKHYFHYLSYAITWLHILPVISTNTTFIIYLTLSCGSTYFLSFLQTLLSLSILCYLVAPHISSHFYKHYFHYLSYAIMWLHILPVISTNTTFIIYLTLSCGSTYFLSFLQTLLSLSILCYHVAPHITCHFYKHYFHYLSYTILWLHIFPVISTNTTFIIYLILSCGSTYFLSFLQTLLSLSILHYLVAPHITCHFYKHYFHYLSHAIMWLHILPVISTNTTFIIYLMLSRGSTYFLSFLQTLLSLSILCYHVAPHISSHLYKHYFHYLSYTIMWLHIFPVISTNTTFIIYLILSCGSTYFLSFLQTLLSLSILHYLVAPHITCHFYKHYFHYLSHAIMWLHILPVISTNTTFIIYLTLSCGSTYYLSFLQTLLSLSILCYHVAPHISCHLYKHYFHYLSHAIMWLHIFPLISTNTTFIIYLTLSCGSTYYLSFLQTLLSLSILCYNVAPHISCHFYKHYFHYPYFTLLLLHIFLLISTNTTFIIYLTLSCGSTYFLSFLQTPLSLSISCYLVAPHISSHFYKHYFHYPSHTIMWLHILPLISTNTTFIIYLMLSCGSTYFLSFLQTPLSLSIICYHVAPHIFYHFYKHYFHRLSYTITWSTYFSLSSHCISLEVINDTT